MRFSSARGRSVVAVSTAETVGTIAACTVAPSPPRVSTLRLKTRGHSGHVVAWRDVQSFGKNAVTVRSAGRLEPEKEVDSDQEAHKNHDPVGKPVITETGESQGTLQDIEFDSEDGHIHTLITTDGQLPGDRLLGVGNFALIEDLGALVRRHRADDSIARALAKIIRSDLIIVDDIGLLPVSPNDGLRRDHAQDPGHRDGRPAHAPRSYRCHPG
ncbi:IstB-like ATP binding protein [Streptomyces wuyuanensis]|uniref:IstB-like ATP binding protein n=1 Tax=Streptomyces wuyuanensis TaxID=1196353 RepID=A0A1H0B3K4_9ACTN|nr:IstB-like ATP binding protein [Streptomyces wuyuanensis]